MEKKNFHAGQRPQQELQEDEDCCEEEESGGGEAGQEGEEEGGGRGVGRGTRDQAERSESDRRHVGG